MNSSFSMILFLLALTSSMVTAEAKFKCGEKRKDVFFYLKDINTGEGKEKNCGWLKRQERKKNKRFVKKVCKQWKRGPNGLLPAKRVCPSVCDRPCPPDPALEPSAVPSFEPTPTPTQEPSLKPSLEPSIVPSSVPSSNPSLLPSMMPSVSTKPTQQYPPFEVVAKVGGNLGDEANRLGVYTFDKMHNGAAAYKNDKNYIVFYGGDDDGWQWVTGYNYWAGNGPNLSDVPDAQAFVRTKQFQIDGDDVGEYASFEVVARVGGNLGDVANRLGVYTFDKMYNGAAAYKNDNGYIVFYGGDDDGWQWVQAYNQWAGDGPKLSDVPDAQAFVRTKQFQIDGDDPAE